MSLSKRNDPQDLEMMENVENYGPVGPTNISSMHTLFEWHHSTIFCTLICYALICKFVMLYVGNSRVVVVLDK